MNIAMENMAPANASQCMKPSPSCQPILVLFKKKKKSVKKIKEGAKERISGIIKAKAVWAHRVQLKEETEAVFKFKPTNQSEKGCNSVRILCLCLLLSFETVIVITAATLAKKNKI